VFESAYVLSPRVKSHSLSCRFQLQPKK